MPRVLVVDDSALMRQFMCDLLGAEQDLTIETARDGKDALLQLRRFKPDVITLDLNMPEMDGLTALAHIMTERPTPVVVVSSLSKKSALVTLEALAMGAVDYIAKPDGTISLQMDDVGKELRAKVRAAARARVGEIPATLPVTEALPALSTRHRRASQEDVREESAAIGRGILSSGRHRPARTAHGNTWPATGKKAVAETDQGEFVRFDGAGRPASTRAAMPATARPANAAALKTTSSAPPVRTRKAAAVSAPALAKLPSGDILPAGGARLEPALAAHADLTPGYADPEGVIVVGVSTGGPRVLPEILRELSANLPWPVVIAQHMPDSFTDSFARRLDDLCPLPVREVREDMPLKPGHVYVARGGYDLGFARRNGRLWLQPLPERSTYLWHPSVEHLVCSAMNHFPARQVIGVMLTGMGYDGAASMTQLKNQGGRTVAESKDTAIVFGMPKELIERNGASEVVPYHKIARTLHMWLKCAD